MSNISFLGPLALLILLSGVISNNVHQEISTEPNSTSLNFPNNIRRDWLTPKIDNHGWSSSEDIETSDQPTRTPTSTPSNLPKTVVTEENYKDKYFDNSIIISSAEIVKLLYHNLSSMLTIVETEVKEELNHNKDLDILDQVRTIALNETTTTPGLLIIYGEKAFPVFAIEYNSAYRPIIGAGRYGNGKYVACSHTSCFTDYWDTPQVDSYQLFVNLLTWLTSGKVNATVGISSSAHQVERYSEIISRSGFLQKSLEDINTELAAKRYDVIILNDKSEVDDEKIEILLQYVSSGGGVILGATPWAHENEETPSHLSAQEIFWANKILNRMAGMTYVVDNDIYIDFSGRVDFSVSRSSLENTHAGKVWNEMKQALHNRTSIEAKQLEHMKIVLDDRIRYVRDDYHFSDEIIDELERLFALNETMTTKEEFKSDFHYHGKCVPIPVAVNGKYGHVLLRIIQEFVDIIHKNGNTDGNSATTERVFSNLI